MSSLEENVLSQENFLAYSRACFDLATALVEKQNYSLPLDTIIIPSRGAVPFFCGMRYSLDKLQLCGGEFEEFPRNLWVDPSLESLLPKASTLHLKSSPSQKPLRVLLAPFTADLNVNRCYSGEDNDEYVLKTRDYWARVTSALFDEPIEREKSPHFNSFVHTILEKVEKRPSVAHLYRSFPKINRAAIIDTVISGQASTNILSAFDTIADERQDSDVSPYGFLICDKNGTKMKPAFKDFLRRRSLQGNAQFFNVPNIVSEDKGASLLGIAAVAYPSIMRASKDMIYNGKPFFVGAGSWHSVTEMGAPYLENFHTFLDLVYQGIDLHFSSEYSGEDVENSRRIFEQSHKNYLSKVREGGIFSHLPPAVDTSLLQLSGKYIPTSYFGTSSGVAHLLFSDLDTQRILDDLRNFNGNRGKVTLKVSDKS